MVPLHRNHDFVVLWSAQLVSMFSAWQATIAATAMSTRSLRHAQRVAVPASA